MFGILKNHIAERPILCYDLHVEMTYATNPTHTTTLFLITK